MTPNTSPLAELLNNTDPATVADEDVKAIMDLIQRIFTLRESHLPTPD